MSSVSSHSDVDAALAHPAVRPLANAGFPLILIGGEPTSVRWANAAALALFGSDDLEALSARALSGADPGAKRLRQVFDSLAPGPPRLERLRFFLNETSEILTWRCQRLSSPAGVLVASALDWTPNQAFEALQNASEDTPHEQSAALVAPPDAEPEQRLEPPFHAPEQAVETGDRPGPSEVRADLEARFPGARAVRFLWQTGRDDLLSVLSGPLCEAVGCRAGDLLGVDFTQIAERLGLDPDGRLRAALAGRDTWTKIEVLWPVAGANAAVPVSLGAVPAFDRQRAFDGWRGFGVVDVVRPQAWAPAPDRAPAPTAAEETSDSPPSLEPSYEPEGASPPPHPDAENSAPEFASGLGALLGDNVVALRPFPSLARVPGSEDHAREESNGLSSSERLAFREIALALGARVGPTGEEASRPTDFAGEAGPKQAEQSSPAPALDETPEPDAKDDAPAQHTAAADDACAAGPTDPRYFLDRSPFGLLASRGDEALWLNHTLLQILGYESQVQFQDAGGLARMLRGRTPHELAQTAAIGDMPVIDRAGGVSILESASHAIDWEGEPAVLTAFRRTVDRADGARVKTLEMELRRRDAEARELHSILDTATDGVAVLDDRGQILSLNRAGEALFGYDQNEVAGESFTVLLAKESHALALDYFAQLASNGVASLLNDGREIMGRARRGGSIPAFMTLGRLNIGGAQKFCAVLRDMTAWKKAERDLNEAKREAERASALKSDFLAKVSHEIRTPLNAILGFAEVIMDERFGPVGNERYKDYLKDIHASGTHVMSLVNDLLDLSKIEAGKMELDFASVDANKIVSECVSIMQPQANSERVIVRLSTTPRLPNVMADERSLRQIVLNLLSNAVKFNEPGGQVIVSTALTDAGHAVIRIRDTGIGMSDNELVTALEPFRQLQTSRQSSGTGLGLPLTKALVEANRASFTVKSRKSEGTLAEVAFPPARVMAE